MLISSYARIAALFTLISSAALFSGASSAYAAMVVSNLDQAADVASNQIYYDVESGDFVSQGQSFSTGALDSILNSVTLFLGLVVSGPFSVQLCNDNGSGAWGFQTFTLTPTASFVGGLNTYAGNYALSANTTYWIVVAPQSDIRLDWAATSSATQTSNFGWTIGNTHSYFYSTKDFSNYYTGQPNVGWMSIDATVVPEPASVALLLCAGGLFLLRCRKRSL